MLRIRQRQLDAYRPSLRANSRARILGRIGADRSSQATLDEQTGDIVATDARGFATRLSFAPDGLPSRVTKPSGERMQFEYDDQGRSSAITYPSGERVAIQRDSHGNVRKLTRPEGGSHELKWEGSRLAAARYPDGTETRLSYEDNGRLAAVTDRSGATTEYQRDPSGRGSVTVDPLGRRTTCWKDAGGGLVAIEFPDGTREGYAYDPERDIATLTRRDGSEVIYQLEQSALRSVTWPDGKVSAFEFAGSNLAVARNEAEVVRSTFDGSGNPLTEETSAGIVRYAYDPDGRLIAMMAPGASQVGFAYDGDGRISRIRDWHGQETAFDYGPDGTIAGIRYGNGVVEKQNYARVGRMSGATVSDPRGEVIAEQSYAYDMLERLTRVSDVDRKSGAAFSLGIDYDAESRVTREAGSVSAAYAYDAKGNLIGVNGTMVQVGRMDEPVSIGAEGIAYDALGNMTRFRGPKGDVQCSYYGDGLLREARVGGRSIRFTYDALCRRVSKTDGTATWRYGWAGHQLLWEEFRSHPSASPVRRDYLFVPDGTTPIAFRELGRTYWLQSDARGAIIRAFDDNGKVVWHATYDSFGRAQVQVDSVRQPFRLIGHYADDETGLHYNCARYYSPHLRSYLSRDPKWHDPGATNYSYARNDPWNRADPFGALPFLLVAAGVVAGAALVGGVVSAAVAYATQDDPDLVAAFVDGAMAGAGAAVGGMLGGPVGLIVGGMIGGALGAFTGSVIEQHNKGEEFCLLCALQAAGISLGIDVLLLGLGRIPGVKRLVKAAGEKLFKMGEPLRKWGKETLEKVKERGRDLIEKAKRYVDPRARKLDRLRKLKETPEGRKQLQEASAMGDPEATFVNNELKAETIRANNPPGRATEQLARGPELENEVHEAMKDRVERAGEVHDLGGPRHTEIDLETSTEIIEIKSGSKRMSDEELKRKASIAKERGKKLVIVHEGGYDNKAATNNTKKICDEMGVEVDIKSADDVVK